jgi:ornithine cyclodeaminase
VPPPSLGDDVVVVTVLDDNDIIERLRPADAVRWIGDAIDAHHRGELIAPARRHADLSAGRLVFTAGRLRGSWFGYRSYDTFATTSDSQVVVVHDEASGQLQAIAVGVELGTRRVGAIGAVAVDVLAPPTAGVVAIIGTGTQAYAQLWALGAVRELREVRVYSRGAERRSSFAERAAPLVAGRCRPVVDARTAVDGAEIVILATNSATPVVDARWLAPGTHVTTLGPKQQGRAEFGPDLPAIASTLVTDSVDQIDAYDPPNVLAGTPYRQRLVSLGEVRSGVAPLPPHGISVFFSVGLAGTEAYLLHQLTHGPREPASATLALGSPRSGWTVGIAARITRTSHPQRSPRKIAVGFFVRQGGVDVTQPRQEARMALSTLREWRPLTEPRRERAWSVRAGRDGGRSA